MSPLSISNWWNVANTAPSNPYLYGRCGNKSGKQSFFEKAQIEIDPLNDSAKSSWSAFGSWGLRRRGWFSHGKRMRPPRLDTSNIHIRDISDDRISPSADKVSHHDRMCPPGPIVDTLCIHTDKRYIIYQNVHIKDELIKSRAFWNINRISEYFHQIMKFSQHNRVRPTRLDTWNIHSGD